MTRTNFHAWRLVTHHSQRLYLKAMLLTFCRVVFIITIANRQKQSVIFRIKLERPSPVYNFGHVVPTRKSRNPLRCFQLAAKLHSWSAVPYWKFIWLSFHFGRLANGTGRPCVCAYVFLRAVAGHCSLMSLPKALVYCHLCDLNSCRKTYLLNSASTQFFHTYHRSTTINCIKLLHL